MKTTVTIITCDKCGDDVTDGNYRTETVHPDVRNAQTRATQYHYCLHCLYKYGHKCDVCLDTFIHIAEHKTGLV